MSNHDGRFDGANARRKEEAERRRRKEDWLRKVEAAETVDDLKEILRRLISWSR